MQHKNLYLIGSLESFHNIVIFFLLLIESNVAYSIQFKRLLHYIQDYVELEMKKTRINHRPID